MVVSQVFAIGAGVVALTTLATFLAPRQVSVERSKIIKASPADILLIDFDMGMNPIARVMGLFMDGIMGKTLTSGLKNLAAVSAG